MNKELLGQFFTPNAIVNKMIALIQNNGKYWNHHVAMELSIIH